MVTGNDDMLELVILQSGENLYWLKKKKKEIKYRLQTSLGNSSVYNQISLTAVCNLKATLAAVCL